MAFPLTDDPQLYGLEISLNKILMIDWFHLNNWMIIVFSKTEKKFMSQQTCK